jgi:hypothetical protein
VEGIFSGTLSYIFNTFDGSEGFSAVVTGARSQVTLTLLEFFGFVLFSSVSSFSNSGRRRALFGVMHCVASFASTDVFIHCLASFGFPFA